MHPLKRNQTTFNLDDRMLYKQRHKIENMFAKLKDWRRIAMRYNQCAHTLFSTPSASQQHASSISINES